jgi:hypothetical protein
VVAGGDRADAGLRDPAWWGNGTACASDAKKFGSWSSNLMTEYSPGVAGLLRDVA